MSRVRPITRASLETLGAARWSRPGEGMRPQLLGWLATPEAKEVGAGKPRRNCWRGCFAEQFEGSGRHGRAATPKTKEELKFGGGLQKPPMTPTRPTPPKGKGRAEEGSMWGYKVQVAETVSEAGPWGRGSRTRNFPLRGGDPGRARESDEEGGAEGWNWKQQGLGHGQASRGSTWDGGLYLHPEAGGGGGRRAGELIGPAPRPAPEQRGTLCQ